MRKGAYQRVAAPRDAIALGYSLVDPSPTSTFDVINVVGHRVCRWVQPSDGQPVRRARGQFELARVGAPGEGGCKVSTASLSLDDSSVGFLPFVLPLPALLHTRRLASRAGGLPFPRAGRLFAGVCDPRAGRRFAGVCDRLQKPRDRLLFLAASLVWARHVRPLPRVDLRLAILLTTFLATRRGRARGGIPLVFPGRGTSQLEPGHGRPPLSMGHVGTQHLPRRRRGNAFEKCTEIRTTEKIQRMF